MKDWTAMLSLTVLLQNLITVQLRSSMMKKDLFPLSY